MSSWSTREDLVHQVVTLHAQGVRWRAIARAVHISRNTVRKILVEHEATRHAEHSALPKPPERAPRPKKIDAFAPKISELFARFPDITAQRVFEELRDAGFTGGYTAVKAYVSSARPRPKATPSLATPVHGPGKIRLRTVSTLERLPAGARRGVVSMNGPHRGPRVDRPSELRSSLCQPVAILSEDG